MAYNLRRFYQGQPDTVEASLFGFDAPDGVIVRELVVCNTTGTAATFSLSIVPGDAATPPSPSQVRLFDTYSVNPNTTVVFDLHTVAFNGDQVYAVQGTASALVLTMSGVAF